MSKIARSMSIVPETGQTLIRRNSPLKSRAQIADGSPRRFFVVRIKNLRRWINALPWLKMIEWSEGEYRGVEEDKAAYETR
jgi:hypothetical protein